ncbi:MAG: hypothetical protein IKG56_00990 [Clostridia bacterium]|nr:hypothetical protein [Clostridia bacterium]
MKINKEKGIANVDYVVALIVFLLGSVAVLGLYLNVYKTMSKIKIDETIIGYMTEICETIDLENYETVDSKDKVQALVDSVAIPNQYKVECSSVDKYNNAREGEEQDIIEKINFRISYKIDDMQREYILSKVKVKE